MNKYVLDGIWCAYYVDIKNFPYRFKTEIGIRGMAQVRVLSEDGENWKLIDKNNHEYKIIGKESSL
jgi:hypothetical protein